MGNIILLFIFAPQLISAFTQNNHNVIKIGIQALRANCVTFTLFGYVAINMYYSNAIHGWNNFSTPLILCFYTKIICNKSRVIVKSLGYIITL